MVAVNHDQLIRAFDYAVDKTRAEGYNVIVRPDYRTNIGQPKQRITDLAGFMVHHFGAKIPASRAVSYSDGLATGRIRPDIGKIICNLTVWKKGGYPNDNGRVTIIVNGVNYTNHAGLGDRGLLDELRDSDVDMDTFKPGPDDLYVNEHYLGAECEGTSINWDQALACVVFFSHVSHSLGMDKDKDGDGKRSPIVGHLESTTRKNDPKGVNMGEVRAEMERYLSRVYGGGTKAPSTPTPNEPKPTPQPNITQRAPRVIDWNNKEFIKITQKAMSIKEDGIRGNGTKSKTREWQKRLGTPVDGVWGASTTVAYLLSLPNIDKNRLNRGAGAGFIQWVGSSTVDYIFGSNTELAVKGMQSWARLTPDGIVGPATKRAIIRT